MKSSVINITSPSVFTIEYGQLSKEYDQLLKEKTIFLEKADNEKAQTRFKSAIKKFVQFLEGILPENRVLGFIKLGKLLIDNDLKQMALGPNERICDDAIKYFEKAKSILLSEATNIAWKELANLQIQLGLYICHYSLHGMYQINKSHLSSINKHREKNPKKSNYVIKKDEEYKAKMHYVTKLEKDKESGLAHINKVCEIWQKYINEEQFSRYLRNVINNTEKGTNHELFAPFIKLFLETIKQNIYIVDHLLNAIFPDIFNKKALSLFCDNILKNYNVQEIIKLNPILSTYLEVLNYYRILIPFIGQGNTEQELLTYNNKIEIVRSIIAEFAPVIAKAKEDEKFYEQRYKEFLTSLEQIQQAVKKRFFKPAKHSATTKPTRTKPKGKSASNKNLNSNSNSEPDEMDSISQLYSAGKFKEAFQKLEKIILVEDIVTKENRLLFVKQLTVAGDCKKSESDWEYLYGDRSKVSDLTKKYFEYYQRADKEIKIALSEASKNNEEECLTWQYFIASTLASDKEENFSTSVAKLEKDEACASRDYVQLEENTPVLEINTSPPSTFASVTIDSEKKQLIDRHPVKAILDNHKQKGFSIYLVGGAVLWLLGKGEPRDFDMVSTATPEMSVKLMGVHSEIVGKHFPIVKANMANFDIEIATMCGKPSATIVKNSIELKNKSVAFYTPTHSIAVDVTHRDITICSLYYDPASGMVLDPTGSGLRDLQAGIIRVLEPMQSFKEDPVRMLRVVRACTKHNFKIEEATAAAIRKSIGLIATVNPSRLLLEVTKLFISSCSTKNFQTLDQLGLLPYLFPSIKSYFNDDMQPQCKQLIDKILAFIDHPTTVLQETSMQALLFAAILWSDIETAKKEYKFKLADPLQAAKQMENKMTDILQQQKVYLPFSLMKKIKNIWRLALSDARVEFSCAEYLPFEEISIDLLLASQIFVTSFSERKPSLLMQSSKWASTTDMTNDNNNNNVTQPSL